MFAPSDHPAAGAALPISRLVRANGLDFHCLVWGQGEPLLLLHGFPDLAVTWRPLAERLAPSFRVIAPDLRGYGRTSRPAGVENYRIELLVKDIADLIEALDLPMVHLCGHDWGGVLAFAFAEQHPQMVASLSVLNAPPAGVLQAMIWNDPDQRLASQYISLLRSPQADALFNEANVDALVERFLGQSLLKGLLSHTDLGAYRDAWTHPGVWQAMLAWYRAAPFDVPDGDIPPMNSSIAQTLINCPVQIIWGDQDAVFVPAMAEAIVHACPGSLLTRLPDAGHVPHRDDPEGCVAVVKAFLAHHPIVQTKKELNP